MMVVGHGQLEVGITDCGQMGTRGRCRVLSARRQNYHHGDATLDGDHFRTLCYDLQVFVPLMKYIFRNKNSIFRHDQISTLFFNFYSRNVAKSGKIIIILY